MFFLMYRRERRVLRPHGAADAAGDAGAGAFDGEHDERDLCGNGGVSERAVWAGSAGADDRDLAVEQGRLGELGGLRSHVADPVYRAALRHQRSGVEETNITPWRRAVAGDLTSAFDFKTPNDATVPLPSTVAYRPPDNAAASGLRAGAADGAGACRSRRTGMRPARALPYALEAQAVVGAGTFGTAAELRQ